MALSTAMLSALSGLRATQAGLDVVATNVANAGTADYTRKRRDNEQALVGNSAVGVRSSEIRRSLDLLLQRQMRAEAAGGAYTTTKTRYHDRLDQLFGTPGEQGSLDTVFNDLTHSLQALSTSPDSYTTRSEVINKAQFFAQHLNNLSGDVQLIRSETEAALGSAVTRSNELLNHIARLNDQVVSLGSGTEPPAALLDERDRYVMELSKLMDIRVVNGEQNKISIFTGSGAMLFDREAAVLSFDGRGNLDARSLYSRDPADRSVGTIRLTSPSGFQVDMIGDNLIRSGEIAALFDLRDRVLVDAQAQLDELAAGTARAISSRLSEGAEITSGTQSGFDIDTLGLQFGNPVEIVTRSGAATTRFTFIEVANPADLPLPDNLSTANSRVVGYSGGMSGLITAATAALGPGYTVTGSGNTLRVLDDGIGGSTDIVSGRATITNTLLQGQGDPFALFVDAGGGKPFTGEFVNGVPQTLGFAARISVNANVVADRSLLVKSSPTTSAADPSRPNHMFDSLMTGSRTFAFGAGLGGSFNPYTGSVAGFAREIVESQGRDAVTAQNIDAGQQVVVRSLADKFREESGVNIDTEMALLVQLQNAYAANARIMSTVKEMIDTLLNM